MKPTYYNVNETIPSNYYQLLSIESSKYNIRNNIDQDHMSITGYMSDVEKIKHLNRFIRANYLEE